jgi:hypothetical protein
MKVCRSIVCSIVLAVVAACGTTSLAQHQSAADRFEQAAFAARSRGDSTEASRLESLAGKERNEAQAAADSMAFDGGAP